VFGKAERRRLVWRPARGRTDSAVNNMGGGTDRVVLTGSFCDRPGSSQAQRLREQLLVRGT